MAVEIHNPSGVPLPFQEKDFLRLLRKIEENENVSFALLEVVYVDEEEIVRINRSHLGKEYVTDIITFRYDEDPGSQSIEGTLYCCAPRIVEQAEEYDTNPEEEFCRIFIHGLLHLAGYEDKSPEEKQEMTRLEDAYLSVLN